MFGPVFVMLYLSAFKFYYHLAEEESSGLFTLVVFLLTLGCHCSVSLPHGFMS